MKTVLMIVAGLALFLGVAIGAVLYFTADERAVARRFVLLSTAGDYAGASALMHDTLKLEFPISSFETGFAGAKPYSEVSFSSVSMTGSVITLAGTATTADGCLSEVSFDFLGEVITGFNITPLCRE